MFPVRALSLLAAVGLAACDASPKASDAWHVSPDEVHFVTEDVPRFWDAVDGMAAATSRAERVAVLQRTYVDAATPGLCTYLEAFSLSASALLDAFDRSRAYYDGIRSATAGFPDADEERALRGIFVAWEALYPKARHPDVTFLIGDTLTAGSVTSAGVVVGTETVARRADDVAFAPSHLVEGHLSRETLPIVLAHEMAHAQQKYYPGPQTVLFWVIIEGSAEFLCELVTGRIANEQLRAYGDAHAAELWAELQTVKNDLGRGWFAASGARPANIGYYIGYRIAKSFYDRQSDPGQAIDAMVNIDDYEGFLQASGYGSQFP